MAVTSHTYSSTGELNIFDITEMEKGQGVCKRKLFSYRPIPEGQRTWEVAASGGRP
jgi:hypothetical protein